MSNEMPLRPAPFNPLDKKNLGTSVAEALLAQPIGPLPPTSAFIGAGVYALYYTGEFPHYEAISALNKRKPSSWPIYVGKAVPAGARKGGYGLGDDAGPVTFRRLVEHATSIQSTKNLSVSDFQCRFLVVDDIWIPLAESLLIEMFSPLWNKKIDGFGNHDPGRGRHGQKRSPWDELHPGRPWAEMLQPAHVQKVKETTQEYLARIRSVLFPDLPPDMGNHS
ncbi:Eco29kI family restriction endonuclease [Gemmatimonas aurantiaca]|uniref:Eco29kI family restriction endonuclease n=1 Tax=Gemmatimonas aurantiaca TaxID=173480 RepID=UPI00301CD6C9